MTATVLPIRSPFSVVPVEPGTAEQLARVAHFRTLDLPEVDELDQVAAHLIGDVGDPVDRQTTWERLRPDAQRLWHLISDDWTEDDLDELTDADWVRNDFATQQQEIDHRYTRTRERLVDDIEHTIRRERYVTVERRRQQQHRVRSVDASMRRHPAGRDLPDGGDVA